MSCLSFEQCQCARSHTAGEDKNNILASGSLYSKEARWLGRFSLLASFKNVLGNNGEIKIERDQQARVHLIGIALKVKMKFEMLLRGPSLLALIYHTFIDRHSVCPVSQMRILVKLGQRHFQFFFCHPQILFFFAWCRNVLCNQGHVWVTNAVFWVSDLVSPSALSGPASREASGRLVPSASQAPTAQPTPCPCSILFLSLVFPPLLGFPNSAAASLPLGNCTVCLTRVSPASVSAQYLVKTAFWSFGLWSFRWVWAAGSPPGAAPREAQWTLIVVYALGSLTQTRTETPKKFFKITESLAICI